MSVSFSALAGIRKHITPRSGALIEGQTIHLMPKMKGGESFLQARPSSLRFSRSTSGRNDLAGCGLPVGCHTAQVIALSAASGEVKFTPAIKLNALVLLLVHEYEWQYK